MGLTMENAIYDRQVAEEPYSSIRREYASWIRTLRLHIFRNWRIQD
jgi:hypothetical protein